MIRSTLLALLAAVAALAADASVAPAIEVSIPSSKDGSAQPALLYVPPQAKTGGAAVPLLVHLHSWSANYKASESLREAIQEAEKRNWVLVSPDFRGPNSRPEACASELAVQDVLDAVAYARKQANVDAKRIYLLGGSGGGHMSLMMSARAPKLWAAVSSWVPISDLADWYASTKAAGLRYSGMMEKCCGGAPGTSAAVDREYRVRSPLFILEKAKGLPLDIEVGIHDGHKGASVPVRHSLRAFNRLAEANGHRGAMISDADIALITAEERLPEALAKDKVDEPGRKHPILFRRSAGPARLTIFEGGHTTDFPTAIRWLAEHSR